VSALSRPGSAQISRCIRCAADCAPSSASRAATVSANLGRSGGDRVQCAAHPEGLDPVRVVHLVGAHGDHDLRQAVSQSGDHRPGTAVADNEVGVRQQQ
jgi:hypothetical protein